MKEIIRFCKEDIFGTTPSKLKRMEYDPDKDYTLEHNNPLMEPMIIIKDK